MIRKYAQTTLWPGKLWHSWHQTGKKKMVLFDHGSQVRYAYRLKGVPYACRYRYMSVPLHTVTFVTMYQPGKRMRRLLNKYKKLRQYLGSCGFCDMQYGVVWYAKRILAWLCIMTLVIVVLFYIQYLLQ